MDPRYGTELLVANLKAGVVRTLVIDDDLDICNGLKDILQDAGYEVDTANSAADGRDCFNQQTYSILIVDYSLPDANGVEIARIVHAQYPWVQTILMTGHDRVEISKNHENSPLLGAFLRKPIDVQTILEVMQKMVHRQCDRFQIARFSPQPQTTSTSITESLPDYKSESVMPKSMAPQKGIAFQTALLIFLIGLASGWLSHGAIKRRYRVGRLHLPISDSILVAAAAPIRIRPEIKLLPPMPQVSAATVPVVASVPGSPGPVPVPKPVPVKKKGEPPTVDWNAQLESNDSNLRFRAAKALLKDTPNHEKAIETLLELTRDPDTDPAVAKASKEGLIRLGKGVVPAMIAKLADPERRSQIVEMLGDMGPAAADAIPALSALENDPEVGIAALKANAQIQPR